MEIRRLHYFMRIAAEGSLGKASLALGISQPALGRQMQILETELGTKLFRRISKGMRLTEEGAYLREALKQPIDMINNAFLNVRSKSVPVDAYLVLGLPPVIGRTFGPRIIRRLRADFPNLRLKIAEGDSGKLAADLTQEAIDIAFLIGVIPSDRIYQFEVLSEEMLLVVPADSEIGQLSEMPFKQLAGVPLILPGIQSAIRSKLAKVELATETLLDIVLEIDLIDLTKAAILAGQGYSIMSRAAFKEENDRSELVGVPIIEPSINQIVRCAVRPLWRVPRTTYDQVMIAIFNEWHMAVEAGEWPATWLFDIAALEQR